MRILRQRQFDETFLRHSDHIRRIGLPSTVAFMSMLSLPLFIFVIMPFCLFSLSGPSSLIALLLAFVIAILSGSHLSELICAIPKNCVVYHCAFAIIGELPAFLLTWISLLDSILLSSLLVTAWSSHTNLLFRRVILDKTFVSIIDENAYLSKEIDLTSVFALIVAVIILSCSLRVLSTVSMCFLSITVLIVASCTMVAFFHGDPQNWIAANFFTHGFFGMLRGCCAMLVAFSGLEATSYALEETKKPSSTLPRLLPLMSTVLSVAFFVIVLIFSLSLNVSQISPHLLVPEMFSILNIPAARYMLTVASVCGLSGAVLVSFLPGSRLLATLSKDGLLPFPVKHSLRSPSFFIILFSLLVLFSLLFNYDLRINMIMFTTPLRLISIVILTYLQHYRPEPIGIPHESSKYKKMNVPSWRRVSGSFSMADSQLSTDTAVFVQMNVAAIETNKLQKRLEQDQQKEFDEESSVLTKSVSQYNTMSSTGRAKSGLIFINKGHDCITESCETPEGASEDNCVHLYHKEVPEIPYVSSFTEGIRPSTPIDMNYEYKRAKTALILFFILSTCTTTIISRTDKYTASTIVLLATFSVLLVGCLYLLSKVTTNDYLHRRHWKMPLFPYMSICTLFMLILCVTTSNWIILIPLAGWVLFGLLIYSFYGFWNSVERGNTTHQYTEEHKNEAYSPILGTESSTS